MKFSNNIVFVGGGRMAEALINGILKAGLVNSGQILVCDPAGERRELLAGQYGVQVAEYASQTVLENTIIILAVKPQIVGTVLDSLKESLNSSHLLISIAAGIPLSFMEQKLAGSGVRIIRVMPNTPALVLEGASVLSGGNGVSGDDLKNAAAIFESVGKALLMDERYLDAVTGLSGSGPAYVFSFLEALIDGGVKVGLAREDAETLALQTILGSVKLAMVNRQHPAQLRAMVTSPGGTTISAVHVLEKAGFQGIVMDAVEAATNRSKELGS